MNSSYIDPRHEVCLCDAGSPDYLAVVAVTEDGSETLLLAHRDSIGDDLVRYDRSCPDAPHEQAGPLPDEYVRRIARPARYVCGRRTKSGGPCQTRVAVAGHACGWHRTGADSGRAEAS